jgi:DNA-binding GntR family transcriptional regulator
MGTVLRVEPVSVRSQLVKKLREAILRGLFKPGQRLIERSLAAEAGTSQVSVREALQVLEQEGLIVKRANTATYVTELSLARLKEIIHVRLLLEPEAAWLASQRLDETTTKALRQLVEEIQAHARNSDVYQSSRADFQFHRALWNLSGNGTLARQLEQICTAYFAYTSILPGLSESELDKQFGSHEELQRHWQTGWERRAERHTSLLDTVIEGDRAAIEAAIRGHIYDGWRWLLEK